MAIQAGKGTTQAAQGTKRSPKSSAHSTNGLRKSIPKVSLKGTPRKDLLGIETLSVKDILDIIHRSDPYYKALSSDKPFQKRTTLAGRTCGNLFFENSTRTRTSFELAQRRLGADYVSLSPAVSSLTKGESLLDTVRVLEAMKLDVIVIRHNAAGVPKFLSERLPNHVHLINAGDGAHEHPTQALLDAASLIAELHDLKGKHIAIVGDIRHSRVARSNIWLLKKLGATVTLVGPTTLIPRDMGDVFGVRVEDELDPVLKEVDAVIALRIQQERQTSGLFPSIGEYHTRYGLTLQRLANTKALVLHPGPINLGVELDHDLAYSERSLVLRQVRRGVAIRMAVLEWLFE
jgi:aspartate carbamoyltransferase catalytic subunit